MNKNIFSFLAVVSLVFCGYSNVSAKKAPLTDLKTKTFKANVKTKNIFLANAEFPREWGKLVSVINIENKEDRFIAFFDAPDVITYVKFTLETTKNKSRFEIENVTQIPRRVETKKTLPPSDNKLQNLESQNALQQESRKLGTISNATKVKHDTESTTIRNMK